MFVPNWLLTALVGVAVLQSTPAADVAAQMTGRWKLNTELSDQAAGRGGGRRGGGPAFALAPGAAQRGARGGGGSEPPPQMPNMTELEAAAQQALGVVQQFPPEMSIEATATQVRFLDPRGESVFQIDGKNTAIDVPGGTLKVKSRWDRAALKQEFSSTQRVLHRTWSIEEGGRLLLLKQRLEGIGVSGKESKAVFDRQ